MAAEKTKIYYITEETEDGETKKIEIPSLKYLIETVNALENMMRAHFNDTDAHNVTSEFTGMPTIDTDEEALPVGLTELPEVNASDIIEDATHRFVTDAQLTMFRDKPTKAAFDTIVNEMYTNLKATFNDNYIKLLNMPDAVVKLRAVATIIKEDDNLTAVMNAIAEKADEEEFESHVNNNLHLTANDRKALNALLKFIQIGCADWNATEDMPNYIRNKPEALPAAGGNATTVEGHGIDDLLNTSPYDIIAGSSAGVIDEYDEDSVTLLCSNMYEYGILQEYIEKSNDSHIYLRKGGYDFGYLVCNSSAELIFEGDGSNTVIICSEGVKFQNHITCKNLSIANSEVVINDNNIFDGVTFNKCTITLEAGNMNIIRNCVFNNCTFKYKGSCFNNMIINNIIKNASINFSYTGGNNLIKDNLSC